ncbi:MAG: hypothetical protein HQL51_03910 [Magnetococcales bacterium]|nr:hypothetical protein [Magnetococcales bacterium]
MAIITATTTVKVGYPDRGLTLRWGEKHKVLIEAPSWTAPTQVHLWRELLVGNIASIERLVRVVVEVGARRVVKTVMVPPKGKTAITTSYLYPENAPPFFADDAKQHREMGALRRFTAPDPARGEAGVWIHLGAVTLGVALPVKAATLPEGPKIEEIDAMPWAFGDTFTLSQAKQPEEAKKKEEAYIFRGEESPGTRSTKDVEIKSKDDPDFRVIVRRTLAFEASDNSGKKFRIGLREAP